MIIYQEYEGLDIVREWWVGTNVTLWIIRPHDGYMVIGRGHFASTQEALNYALEYIGAITADW